MKLVWAAAAAAVALAFAPAGAAPITYTLTGTATGTLGTAGFVSAPFTLVAKGDTAALVFPVGPGIPAVPLGSLTITYTALGTQTVTATDSIDFFANSFNGSAGFADVTSLQDVVDFTNPAFSTYDAITALGPVSVTGDFLGHVMTDAGDFTFLSASSLTFQAVTAGAVPEPGTLLLIGAGLFGLGWSVRRRTAAS